MARGGRSNQSRDTTVVKTQRILHGRNEEIRTSFEELIGKQAGWRVGTFTSSLGSLRIAG